MRRWFLVFAFVLLGALFFHPAPARAGMHFCNKTSSTVYLAMATLDDIYDAHVWGWWTIVPGACKTPIGADLDTSGGLDYYYYAHDDAGDTWTGEDKFCVDTVNAFDFDDRQESDCATGAHRYFKYIHTYGDRDHTVDLT